MKHNFNIQFFGGGSWDETSYSTYAASKGRIFNRVTKMSTGQNMFTERHLHDSLNPYKVTRECCDSEEHPNTVPVILALDVTGSMGSACKRTATSLGVIMSDLYKSHKDIEFMMMAIGDLAYDEAPIQASQFESDTRIAEAIDNIYFEGGGGGNKFESYTAAWYFGLRHTKLDCWNRGKKGIIITMGDEPLNPYLPKRPLVSTLGDNFLQDDVETNTLYEEVLNKFHIFHIGVNDSHNCFSNYKTEIEESFGKLLGDRYIVSNLNTLPTVITKCIDLSVEFQPTVVVDTISTTPITDTDHSEEESENSATQINPDTGAIRW